jgi:hypothetical protein
MENKDVFHDWLLSSKKEIYVGRPLLLLLLELFVLVGIVNQD